MEWSKRFLAGKILPAEEAQELADRYGEVIAAYPRVEADIVSCHNDLKPQNLIYDGERIWIVDWEAAFRNDRYVDLAYPAFFFVRNEREEEAYLTEYFGEAPGEYRRAKLYLTQQLVSVFIVAFLFRAGTTSPAPDFREYHRRLAAREIDLETPEAKLEWAKAHLAEFLRNSRTERFADSLARVTPKTP